MISHTPKVVFITGATGGFGTAIARRFAALGCRLVLAGRNDDRVRALAAALAPERTHSDEHVSPREVKQNDGRLLGPPRAAR